MVNLCPETTHGESVAKHGKLRLIILILICKSDMKETHGNLSNPFPEQKVHGQKHPSIPYISHFMLSNYCQHPVQDNHSPRRAWYGCDKVINVRYLFHRRAN